MKPTTKKKSDNSMLYAGIALLVGVGAYAMNDKKKQSVAPESDPTQPLPTQPVSSTPLALNYDLVLKLGSRGQEVAKLQSMMGISADGIFGSQTQTKLYALKRVNSVSLNGYARITTAAPLTKVVFPAGTKVMVKNRDGAKVYEAERKADGSYFSTGKVTKTFSFGEKVGVIRAPSADGQAHSVVYKSFWYGDFFFDDAVGFVNTIDIEKYT